VFSCNLDCASRVGFSLVQASIRKSALKIVCCKSAPLFSCKPHFFGKRPLEPAQRFLKMLLHVWPQAYLYQSLRAPKQALLLVMLLDEGALVLMRKAPIDDGNSLIIICLLNRSFLKRFFSRMGCNQQIAQSIHAYLEVHPLHTLQPAPPCGVKRTTPMHCHNALLLQNGRKMPMMFDWNADIVL